MGGLREGSGEERIKGYLIGEQKGDQQEGKSYAKHMVEWRRGEHKGIERRTERSLEEESKEENIVDIRRTSREESRG
jgi:hypothetical protein